MKKSAQVVMLPTNEKAPNHDYLFLYKPSNRLVKNGFVQHLYFLSDEEIKEGDWVYDVCDGIVKVEHEYQLSHIMVFKKDCKKIIATTDRSLTIEIFGLGETAMCSLPQIPQSFIEHYVSEYNKDNVIDKVLVEYESIGAYANPKYDSDYQLKINSDNTINISKSKKSWNREEVVELLYKHTEYMLSGKKDTLDKWIEENL